MQEPTRKQNKAKAVGSMQAYTNKAAIMAIAIVVAPGASMQCAQTAKQMPSVLGLRPSCKDRLSCKAKAG